ncbi:MAG: bifunctional riboflavin kinase/FAD synthetase [Hyphomonadaceae bacterium]|nr:bifunctional riboflavin kinase/FAD synthetase [Clostridia bacterium]
MRKIMKIIEDLKQLNMTFLNGSGVALGNFDGLHKGHISLLRRHLEACHKKGLAAGVFTFSNHPAHVLLKGRPFSLIMSNDEKIALLGASGLDFLILQAFDEAFREISANDFIMNILVHTLNAKHITVGQNFRFGKQGLGTVEMLEKAGAAHGFSVTVVPLYEAKSKVVSSTAIRKLVQIGDMSGAQTMLGRPYTVTGVVKLGKQLGSKIGFPTLNILPESWRLLPKFGVYMTKTTIGDHTYKSITNVGINPTVGDPSPRIETHLLDFSGDLYGQIITVSFLGKIRSEKKFESVQALQTQIAIDVKKARDYFALIQNCTGK